MWEGHSLPGAAEAGTELILALRTAPACSVFCSSAVGAVVFNTCYEQLGKLLRLFEPHGVLLSVPGLMKAFFQVEEYVWPPQLGSLSSRPV